MIVLIAAVFVVSAIILVAWKSNKFLQQAVTLPTSSQYVIGEEVKVNGVVSENYRGCEMDGLCYINLLSNGKMVRVVYHYGEYPRCLNVGVIEGEKGDEVEVFGKITAQYGLSTCDSTNYYIKKIKGNVTSTWQTYRNDEFGFEVRYPEGGYLETKILDTTVPNTNQIQLSYKNQKEQKSWDGFMFVAIEPDTLGRKTVFDFGLLPGTEYVKVGAFEYDALKLLVNYPDSAGYILIRYGKQYRIDVETRTDGLMNTFDKILSTFRFAE